MRCYKLFHEVGRHLFDSDDAGIGTTRIRSGRSRKRWWLQCSLILSRILKQLITVLGKLDKAGQKPFLSIPAHHCSGVFTFLFF